MFINYIDLCHPHDLSRINNSDAWLKRFLYHNEDNHDDALTMLWNTCEWRKSFGVNGKFIDNTFQYFLGVSISLLPFILKVLNKKS